MSANDSRINPLLLGSSPGRRALLMQNATSTPSADTLNSAINGNKEKRVARSKADEKEKTKRSKTKKRIEEKRRETRGEENNLSREP